MDAEQLHTERVKAAWLSFLKEAELRDLGNPLTCFSAGFEAGIEAGFEAGVESALRRVEEIHEEGSKYGEE